MNIVLTGFMGTGKSVIGKNVANILGWKFIDIDTEIEKEAKKTIREIFNDDGEPFFRQLEKRVCHRISKYNKTVIATGGGTFIDIENKNSLSKNGIIICLKCKPEIILKRLTSDKNYIISRPLLAKPDPKANIENLLHERKNIYETIQLSIDTSNLSINETSRRIIDLYNQSKLNVNYPGGSYDVLIKHGLIHHIGEQLKNINVASHRKIIIVTNKTIAKYHLSDLSHSITNAGYEVIECFIPDGEQYKNINTVNKLYDDLIKEKVDRNALILAFGGGIVGDIAGYVAATYMRGVDFVNVPTSLLAMVDASIGGKTGYDHKEGKNLIGAFKQPVSVFIDPNLLRTLENSEILSGFSELFKTSIIADPELFNEIDQYTKIQEPWFIKTMGLQWISKSLKVKSDIVTSDPFERNIRAWLNLGHTLAHALEKISGYSIRHGDAVSMGTNFACRLSTSLNIMQLSTYQRVIENYKKWELPIKVPAYSTTSILNNMKMDKKVRRNTIRWILPIEIGKVDIFENIDQNIIISELIKSGAVYE